MMDDGVYVGLLMIGAQKTLRIFCCTSAVGGLEGTFFFFLLVKILNRGRRESAS